MNTVELTTRLIGHALGELADRVERMAAAELIAALAELQADGRSAAGDLVVAVLDRERQRRDSEART